ncbi:MAG: hypothetical protein HJJLKODD_02098 [Phycisphaerae bacterium]|nr:hypothetical protein [Phycisphaerae bacterium]
MVKVRIMDHDRRREISIGVVLGAVVVFYVGWWLWTDRPQWPIAERQLSEITVIYQCDQGHRFPGALSEISQACRVTGCGSRAWPIWTMQCSRHGPLLMQLRYGYPPNSHQLKIISARPPLGSWKKVQQTITCPWCERMLTPETILFTPPPNFSNAPPVSTAASAPAAQSAGE